VSHIPHLYLSPPWGGPKIVLAPAQLHHLRSVLRLPGGSPVTYTDGAGLAGAGELDGDEVVRGEETRLPPPEVRLTLAVAPPRDRHRARYLVEKAAELEVSALRWLRTAYSVGRAPGGERSRAWAVGALEQSRGSWLMDVEEEAVDLGVLEGEVWFADLDGFPLPSTRPAAVTVAIGPEGGWAPGECPPGARRLGLGRTVLRVETAAVVAAALMRA
jgi:16S rRNA U1498 N3-methylase RsmE